MNVRSGVALAEPREATASEHRGSGASAEPSRRYRDAELPALAGVFGLLADPGRLRILLVLRDGEANVGELSATSGLSESATSHALRLLRSYGAVRVRRAGRLAFYSLADEHVRDLLDIAVAHAEHTRPEPPP